MDLDRAQADWTLRRFPSEELPELAARMMVQGHDGPAILELASFHRPGPWDVPRALVDRAFAETGRPPLSPREVDDLRDEALLQEAERQIVDCLQEGLAVRELGQAIWRLSGCVDDRWGPAFRALLVGHLVLEDAWTAAERRRAELDLLRLAGEFLKTRRR